MDVPIKPSNLFAYNFLLAKATLEATGIKKSFLCFPSLPFPYFSLIFFKYCIEKSVMLSKFCSFSMDTSICFTFSVFSVRSYLLIL